MNWDVGNVTEYRGSVRDWQERSFLGLDKESLSQQLPVVRHLQQGEDCLCCRKLSNLRSPLHRIRRWCSGGLEVKAACEELF